jgi:hypothetical protein
MKIIVNFYRVTFAVLLLLLIAGCKGQGRYGEESGTPTTSTTTSDEGFDPLELPQDSRIVPQLVPKHGEIRGIDAGNNSQLTDSAISDSANNTIVTPQMDTLASQALRIQIYATELFAEAKRELRIAEEVFDQPVFLDYEVPYYKVRVGGFANRKEAETYLLKAKSAGYSNAWVVAVRVNTKEASPLYEDLEVPETDSAKGN